MSSMQAKVIYIYIYITLHFYTTGKIFYVNHEDSIVLSKTNIHNYLVIQCSSHLKFARIVELILRAFQLYNVVVNFLATSKLKSFHLISFFHFLEYRKLM